MRVATLTPKQIVDIAPTRAWRPTCKPSPKLLADDPDVPMTVFLKGWTRYEQRAFDPDPVVEPEAHLAFAPSQHLGSLGERSAAEDVTRNGRMTYTGAYDVHAKLWQPYILAT